MGAHRPGRREAMEAALTEVQREELFRSLARNGIELDRWHVIPGIARTFEEWAWANISDSLIARGVSRERAELAAAANLGLEASAIQKRISRYKAEAITRAKTKCPQYPHAA